MVMSGDPPELKWAASAVEPSCMAKQSRNLTRDELSGAIYLDIVRDHVGEPVLVGALSVARDGSSTLRRYVVHPSFASAGTASGLPVEEISRVLARTLDRAASQRRSVIVWGPDRDDGMVGRLRYARPSAKRWRAARHPDVAFERDGNGKRNRLDRYLPLVGYEIPARFAAAKVGDHLRVLRTQLERGVAFDDLRPTTKRRWEDVLGHDEHDCRGMRALCEVVAAELGEPSSKKRRKGKRKVA